MVDTAGYSAGFEANNTVVSLAQEVTFGVAPAVAFQAIRLTAESLLVNKKRDRPAEFNTNAEVQSAITSSLSAGGDLSFALSFGTFDGLLAGSLRGNWTAPVTIQGVGGDLALTAPAGGVSTLTSTTANKFSAVVAGAWVRLAGFTNAANNGVFRVVTATGTVLTLAAAYGVTTIAETPAGAAASVVLASLLRNSTSVKTFFVQKKLSSNVFLTYPGSYVSAFTLSGGVGKFLSGKFTLLTINELPATTDSSTGAVLAAPGGTVNNSVGNFGGVFQNGLLLTNTVDSFDVTLTADGAAAEYGMGSSSSQGLLAGIAEAKGTLKIYLRDLVLYNQFIQESASCIEFLTRDGAGNAYIISFLSATLVNPAANAAGQNQAVMATFNIEGNPLPVGGGTFAISRV